MTDTFRSAAHSLANAVNCNTFGTADFVDQLTHCEHRTLQQLSFGVMLACIKEWSAQYDNNTYDARNEATVILCHEIVEHFGDRLDYLPYI